MALYHPLEASEIDEVARAFGLGVVQAAIGVPQGSINTNYRLETQSGRYFLRHTAVRSAEDLRFEAGLLALLADSQFPAPRWVATRSGEPFFPLHGGFVSVFGYLAGEELARAQVTSEHCERLGAELGKLHRLAQSFSGSRDNPYGLEVVRGWVDGLAEQTDPELSSVTRSLRTNLDRAAAAFSPLVPRGPIHADLFLDNVKWVGDRVSALFDFEMACVAPFTLDLAITLNAWCFDQTYRPELTSALVRGYQQERKLSANERDDLYARALFGAVRYTASRIRDFHLSPLPPDRLVKKDFRTYWERCRALERLGTTDFLALIS